MRVLVVEDEEPLAQVIRRGLATEGFVVDIVHTGEDGLWAATEENYDVVILDIMLPVLNGFEVIEQLRSRQVWTPVLMLTALDDDLDQAAGFDLGADDYLTKPFSFTVLKARLRALARRGAPERPAILRVGDLSLDPARRRVHHGDTEIALTPKEFSLLRFLMSHAGDVVTKSEILDRVWDSAFEGDVNVVEVYIGYLRRKLGMPAGRPTIETVRGAGYRLVDQ